MKRVKRIVFEVSEKDHRNIKAQAASAGMTIREYILKAVARDIYETERRK
jgi:predicted DNA binding CopG/RHH family protein